VTEVDRRGRHELRRAGPIGDPTQVGGVVVGERIGKSKRCLDAEGVYINTV
jgi:hypothetical protein